MATITYQNGITILPSIGDLAEVFNGLVVTSSNASAVVLENAFGKITLNAALVPNQFAYGSYGEYPVSGNIESVSVQVYSAAGTLANFASFAYGASPLAVTVSRSMRNRCSSRPTRSTVPRLRTGCTGAAAMTP